MLDDRPVPLLPFAIGIVALILFVCAARLPWIDARAMTWPGPIRWVYFGFKWYCIILFGGALFYSWILHNQLVSVTLKDLARAVFPHDEFTFNVMAIPAAIALGHRELQRRAASETAPAGQSETAPRQRSSASP